MSAVTCAASSRTASATAAQSVRFCWKVVSRPCPRGDVGRRVDRRGVDAATEPAVPRPHRRAEPVGQHLRLGRGELARRCGCRARRACAAVLRPIAPQRVGGPLPHHLEPVSRGEPEDAARLAEARWRSWPAACCRRCRPSSAAGSRSSTAARTSSANASGSSVSTPRKASSQPSTSTGTSKRAQRVHHLRRRRVVGRWSTGRNTASGHLRAAVRSGMPEPDAERPRLVGRGGHHPALGRVAAAADDHRQAGQLGAAQHLDRGDELVEVDVQHPAARVLVGRAHGPIIAPPGCRRRALGSCHEQSRDAGGRCRTRVGASVARRFGREGYDVALLSRSRRAADRPGREPAGRGHHDRLERRRRHRRRALHGRGRAVRRPRRPPRRPALQPERVPARGPAVPDPGRAARRRPARGGAAAHRGAGGPAVPAPGGRVVATGSMAADRPWHEAASLGVQKAGAAQPGPQHRRDAARRRHPGGVGDRQRHPGARHRLRPRPGRRRDLRGHPAARGRVAGRGALPAAR